jgi:hypothetical protein
MMNLKKEREDTMRALRAAQARGDKRGVALARKRLAAIKVIEETRPK